MRYSRTRLHGVSKWKMVSIEGFFSSGLDETNAIHPKDITSKGPGAGDSNWDAREMEKLISAKAVDFIDTHAGEKPFFLYCYCSPMAHLPHCPPEEFDGRPVAGSTPSLHLDCVVDLDCQVARILGALKKNQVLDDTLIIFMSDNGGLVNIDPNDKGLGYNSAGGWAGGKNSPLEGGIGLRLLLFGREKLRREACGTSWWLIPIYWQHWPLWLEPMCHQSSDGFEESTAYIAG